MDKYIMETNIVTKQKDEVKIKKPKNYIKQFFMIMI